MDEKKITLDELIEIQNKEMDAILRITDDQILPIAEIIKNYPAKCDHYSCGFPIFNEVMAGGFKDGDLIIISGISGEGKTLMAQTLTYHFCKIGIPCLWFSYEVSLKHLDEKFNQMGISDFYYAYAPKKNTTGKLDWLKYKIKESWLKYNTKIVFIDHIDFLSPMSEKNRDNEAIILKKITTELKTLAIELDIIIIVMAHLKKINNNQEPEMQDIGYSAGIFQLADYVFMVFREKNKLYKSFSSGENTGDTYTNNSIIKLVKNRQTGQLKYLKVKYNKGKFMELTEIYDDKQMFNY